MSSRIDELYALGGRSTAAAAPSAARTASEEGLFSELLDAQMGTGAQGASASLNAGAFAALAMGGGSGMLGAVLARLAGEFGGANTAQAPAAAAKAYRGQSLDSGAAQTAVQEGPRTVSGGGYADIMIEPEYYDPECTPRVFIAGG